MNEIVDVPAKRKKARHIRALTVASCVMFFFSSFVPSAFGAPGATVFLWGCLLSFIIWKSIK